MYTKNSRFIKQPMGAGLQTFYYFAENFSDYSYALGLGIVAAFLIFYLLDVDSWKSKVGIFLRSVYIMGILLGLIAFCLFIAEERPASPIAIFAFLVPLWLFFIKRIFFPKVDFRLYVSQLTGPLFIASMGHFIAFGTWAFSSPNRRYNIETAKIYGKETGCEVNENCDTFIIYIGPVLVGLVLFFFSFFASFLHSKSPTKDITNFIKLWMILMFIFWVTISLNFASNSLTETLIILTFAAFAGSVFLLVASYTKDELHEQEKELWHNFVERYASYLDILRGFSVVLLLPVGFIYLFLSFLNQSIRKLSCPFSKPIGTHRGLLTKKTSAQLNAVKTWNTSKVITYAIYWGVGYMIYQVIAAQFLTLFLGW